MTITVSSTDPRSVRALAVLATADRWVRGHRKSDGRAFFSIPGSNGRVYFTDTRDCTCPDARERGETCKDQLAVRLWTLQNAPAQPAATTVAAPARDDVDDLLDGVAAIKALFGSESAGELAGPMVQTYPRTDRYSQLFPADQG